MNKNDTVSTACRNEQLNHKTPRYYMTRKKSKQIKRIVLLIGTVISLFFYHGFCYGHGGLIAGFCQIPDDTMRIEANTVVFFSITDQEYEEILEDEGEGGGINEIIADFNFYTNRIQSLYAKNNKINIISTAHRWLKIELMSDSILFDRLKYKDHAVGMILSDGLKYKIIGGVDTDVGMAQSIEDFFQMK